MNNFTRDFVSNEKRDFSFKIGNTLASALSGFIAGIVGSIIVSVVFYFLFIK